MAKTLASNGFVAVTVEYRLSTEAFYPAAVNDLKAALRWMRKKSGKYRIDTSKIATLGCSAGGQLAALLGTTGDLQSFGEHIKCKYSSRVQAIVDMDGILAFIHPESGEGDDSKSTSAATYWFGAGKAQKPELWNQASALSHISKNTPPILFINSSVARMHAGRDDAIKQLKALNIYSEVHTFPDAPHPFWFFNPWFEPTMDYTISFLKKVFGERAF
jgi:pectinesterase